MNNLYRAKCEIAIYEKDFDGEYCHFGNLIKQNDIIFAITLPKIKFIKSVGRVKCFYALHNKKVTLTFWEYVDESDNVDNTWEKINAL